MQPFEFLAPHTLPEALDLLAADETIALAGGTAVIPMMKTNLLAPRRVVWLGRVRQLRAMQVGPTGSLQVGAGCTLTEVARSPVVAGGWPEVARVAGGIGNVRVRAVATVGGHLAHADPDQDLPPLLLALDAEVHLEGPRGRRTLPLARFFIDYMETALLPGELITTVVVPPLPPQARALYLKFTPRSLDDFPTVGVAGYLRMSVDRTVSQVRVALAGVATTPMLVRGAAEALAGRRPTADALAEAASAAAAEAAPWDDHRGTVGYKRAMSRVWTRRCLQMLLA
jgi:aerobic carbon-monoxide dehydrogenase medium subunit